MVVSWVFLVTLFILERAREEHFSCLEDFIDKSSGKTTFNIRFLVTVEVFISMQ